MFTHQKVTISKGKSCWSATWGGSLALTCVLLASATLSFAATSKVSPDLQSQRASDRVNVIVQFRQPPTAVHHQKVMRLGGSLQRDLSLVKAASYSLPAQALATLAADPDVAYISPDRPVSVTSTTQTLDYYEPTINATWVWLVGLNGSGVGVAVIDSGISSMPDLQSGQHIVYSQSFVGGNTNDQYGHGTHVAGILAGNGSASRGSSFLYTVQGVAQSVNIVNLRVLDQNGQGNDSSVISAIQTAIQLKNTYNIRIINLSLGRPVYESYTQDPLCQAVEQAWQAGIVVVVAAGNDGRDNSANTYGYGTIGAPGNDPYVITVGAMNTLGQSARTNDVPASYSSKGPTLFDHIVKPDIVAPGNQIISLYQSPFTLNQQYPANEVNASLLQSGGVGKSNTYFILSGTSMATPMVSGTVALMLQVFPNLTPDQVKARLMKGAYKNLVPSSTAVDPVTGQIYNMQADIFTVGAGLLDVVGALINTDLAPANPGSALSPTATQDRSGNVVLSNNSQLIWGSGVWGNTVVWGVSQFSGIDSGGLSVLSGNTVCWGNNTLAGFTVVWGNTVVWGVGQPQGEASTLAIDGDNEGN